MSLPLIKSCPILPPSQNEVLRSHWGLLARAKDDFTLMIPMCPAADRQQDGERRLVEITFVKTRGPLSDPDNRTARCKAPLDALVRRQWIRDDSPQWIELRVAEVVGNCKTASTVIAVSAIEAEAEAA